MDASSLPHIMRDTSTGRSSPVPRNLSGGVWRNVARGEAWKRRVITALAMCGALLLAACAFSPSTVHQFMDQRGFGGPSMVVLIQMDGATRNISPDMPAVLEAMKHTTMVSRRAVTPACVINLNTGSSSQMQNMWVYIAESGDGYVEYMGTTSFFTGAALRGFCAAEFARGKTLEVGIPPPGKHVDYVPVPTCELYRLDCPTRGHGE